MKALAIGILVSCYFLRHGFAWLLPSRLHRAIACLVLAVAPGSRAVYGELEWGHAAAFLAGLLYLERGPGALKKKGFGAACFAAAAFLSPAFSAYGAGLSDLKANFFGRVVFAPVLGPRWTEALLSSSPVSFWAASLAAAAFFALLFYKFPAERNPFLALLVTALLAAPAAGAYTGSLGMTEARSFLPGVFALLAWLCLFFRGLKETAVVIYFAAVSILGIYLLVLHHVLLFYHGAT